MSQGWVNAVYYPNWRVYKGQTPASMPVNAVTHVMYAFIKVNTDGSLKLIDDWADTQIPVDGTKGCLSATAKLKASKPSIRTLVSVGGGTGSAEFPALAANPTARARFAKEIKAFCDKWQLNGVDSKSPLLPSYNHLLSGSDTLSKLTGNTQATPSRAKTTSASSAMSANRCQRGSTS